MPACKGTERPRLTVAGRAAARAVRRGGCIIHATEAVFGIAAGALNRAACERVRELKRRPRGKAFIVVAASVEQLHGLVRLDSDYAPEALSSWPGPSTWIFPADPRAPRWLRERGTIAVRVTAHPEVAALCEAAGPLVSTSANPASRPAARTLLNARRYFGRCIDYYLAGRLGGLRTPTRIRDGRTGKIVRA